MSLGRIPYVRSQARPLVTGFRCSVLFWRIVRLAEPVDVPAGQPTRGGLGHAELPHRDQVRHGALAVGGPQLLDVGRVLLLQRGELGIVVGLLERVVPSGRRKPDSSGPCQ
ncbi:hypothetical protein [Nonomuraea recticatena]|uniref:hypothetical protein n=1 Tax=Nonomuraea recticatena TaxID=46178 RepID=UPI0031F97F1C